MHTNVEHIITKGIQIYMRKWKDTCINLDIYYYKGRTNYVYY